MGLTQTVKKYLDPKSGILFWISVLAFGVFILLIMSRKFNLSIPVATPLAERIVS